MDVFAQFDTGHTFGDEEEFREAIEDELGVNVDLVTTLANTTDQFKFEFIRDMVIAFERKDDGNARSSLAPLR